MALRAGYYGLKNTVKKKLEKLAADTSGMKIIKTIGDGLNLTDAGKLNVKAATASALGGIKVGEGLEIVNGVLNVTISGGYDYSSSNIVDTGQKWIDGKTIYCRVFTGVSIPKTAYTTSLDLTVEIDTLIKLEVGECTSGQDLVMNNGNYAKIIKTQGSNTVINPTNYIGALTNAIVIAYFTLPEEEE